MSLVVLGHNNGIGVFWPVFGSDGDSAWPLPRRGLGISHAPGDSVDHFLYVTLGNLTQPSSLDLPQGVGMEGLTC